MNRNLNRRIHPIAEADGLSPKKPRKVNTFYHELTHCILQTMGEHELNDNEKFVCCFAGFLTEAMRNLKFEEE